VRVGELGAGALAAVRREIYAWPALQELARAGY
jgi:hypothetical protein